MTDAVSGKPARLHRHRLDVAYDGTAYAGWQIQPGRPTVQEALEQALARLQGARPKVHGSGRTDQGVHARAQVAHVDLCRIWTPLSLRRALNGLLPADIRIIKTRRAAATFHARHSVVAKEYRYLIWNDEVLPPHLRLTHTHIRRPLSLEAMVAVALALSGRHDFTAFSANPSRPVPDPVRTLSLRVTRKGCAITIRAVCEGFLYKMVRSLAGFLIAAGEGRYGPEDARRFLVSRQRTAHVETAPPHGLFLWRVRY